MEVYLNSVHGLDDAIISMFLSKRTLTRELEEDIRYTYYLLHEMDGFPMYTAPDGKNDKVVEKFNKWKESLFKWGWRHMTMLKFIDLSFTVYGLHRAGQDDWDSHAKRMDNRIIRSSTRLADFSEGEMSDYYKDKILTTDQALNIIEFKKPDTIEFNGEEYIKAPNGYIKKGFENNKDVKRGLYMLSIPSNFIFKVNLAEFAHIYKERNKNGTANPEVKELAEECANQLQQFIPEVDKDYLIKIQN